MRDWLADYTATYSKRVGAKSRQMAHFMPKSRSLWKHGEGDFLCKKHDYKWLIQFDSNKELQIIEKEVSKYAPINRILDRVGFSS